MTDIPFELRHGGDVFCVLWTLTEGRQTTYGALDGDGRFVTVTVPFAYTVDAEVAALLAHAAEHRRRAERNARCVGPRV